MKIPKDHQAVRPYNESKGGQIMKSLQDYFGDRQETIFAIAQFIEDHIAENTETVLQRDKDKLSHAYETAGDAAYGTFLNLLLLPVHKQLKEAGFRPEPSLPGDFEISREWGTTEEGDDQQRWMWSTITAQDGEPLGTIVSIVYHDHTRFRLPRPPQIIALTETNKEDIVKELSKRSDDFKNAREFHIEYEEYLRTQGDQD